MELLRARSLVVVLAAFAACIPAFAEEQTLIRQGRILAVQAVPAEAKAGETVELRALIATPPDEAPRPDTLEWAMCVARKPLTELGPVAQECIDRFGAGSPNIRRLGRGPTAAGTILPDACRKFGPLSAPTEAGGVAARPVDPDLSGGYHQPILVGSEVGLALASVRLNCGIVGVPNAEVIRFNQGYRPNTNPELDRVEIVDGAQPLAEATVPLGARVDLRAVWAACPRTPVCGDGLCTAGENQSICAEDCSAGAVTKPRGCTGAETYLWADAASGTVGERREGIAIAWYATAGTFAENQTGRTEADPDGVDSVNAWTAPSAPGQVKIWVVVRDDRGGVGWREHLVRVAP